MKKEILKRIEKRIINDIACFFMIMTVYVLILNLCNWCAITFFKEHYFFERVNVYAWSYNNSFIGNTRS